MIERDAYPAGVPCWVEAGQPDLDAAVAFYGGLFGWEFEELAPGGSAHRYCIAHLRGHPVAALRAHPDGTSPAWRTYVRVDDAAAAVASVRQAGGAVLVDPFDLGDAGRVAVCADPSGAGFGVWQARRLEGARLVNEPGAWNFSELNTPDPEGAKAFYGRVFGWEVSALGDDGGFWRMPGYGDFLERLDPEVRTRQADVGAPEGFEDAVAWLVPQTADPSPGAAAHWSVTFAVDDADAAAGRAETLGGEVLVPPADAPWVRLTVLRDPGGAVFTASRFTPPA